MRNPSSQPSNGFHFVGIMQLLFQSFLFCDVPKHSQMLIGQDVGNKATICETLGFLTLSFNVKSGPGLAQLPETVPMVGNVLNRKVIQLLPKKMASRLSK